jgi:hypothetical protein
MDISLFKVMNWAKQKSIFCSWLDRCNLRNNFHWMVDFHRCGNERHYNMRNLMVFPGMTIVQVLYTWEEWYPLCYIYCLWFAAHPSIRIWDELNGKPPRLNSVQSGLIKLIESDITLWTRAGVNAQAMVGFKKKGSQGMMVASWSCSIQNITESSLNWHVWQTEHLKVADSDYPTVEFHHDTWNCQLMLGCVSAHIPWNVISNLELRQSFNALLSDLVLPSTSTLSNICHR